MNKDMINIDDFVREKLGGQTQKEDAGAWLKMKALLDEEMPEKAAPFIFRLSKPMAFLGAALLVGALCVGGYTLSSLRDKKTTTEQNAITLNTNPNSNNNTNTNTTNTLDQNNNTSSNKDLQDANLSSNNTDAADNAINSVTNENKNNTASQGLGGNDNSSVTDRSVDNSASSGADKMNAKGQNVSGSAGNKHQSPLANNHSATSNRNALAKTIGKNKAAQQDKHNNADASAAALSNVEHACANTNKARVPGSKADRTYASGNGKTDKNAERSLRNKNKSAAEKGKVADDASAAAGDKNLAQTEKTKDSIKTITLVTKETVSKGYPKKTILKTDTINLGKVEVTTENINNTIVSNSKPTEESIKQAASEGKKANKQASKNEAARQKNILAAKNASVATQNEAANTSASSKESAVVAKAKKEKNGIGAWIKNLDVQAAVADAKRDMRNAKFYAGFSGGVNATVGNNSFQGVQFGPTGELVFNKHWSLFGAIRYFNRSGSKKTVNDNYSREISSNTPDSTKGLIWYYTVRTDSTNRFYNFSTVHSFEMPVTVRYTIRKFYLMTGINLAYYLPVNVEQVEREYNNMNIHVVPLNSTKPILTETKPMLSSTDFGSRFGLGYVIGAGYQISPAWQADFRLVNSFWDNAKGAGAKSLSKDFYKLPSMQITIGYQFGRDRKKQSYGPTSTP